jgi:DivIVA domain-containing protein
VPLLFLFVVLAVLAIVAVLAVGRGGALPEPVVDRAPLGLPDGPLDAAALQAVHFSAAFRGYRMDQVDEVLDRLASELAERDARITHLEERLQHVEHSVAGPAPDSLSSELSPDGMAGSPPDSALGGFAGAVPEAEPWPEAVVPDPTREPRRAVRPRPVPREED